MKLSFLVGSFAVALATVTGCAATSGEATGEASQELGQTVNVPNPSGAYVASINANGSGCPAGSWSAGISDDGQAFTVSFSSYEAVVEPGTAFAIKDCTLAIDLKTPEGFSFSVSSFHYQGYAILDQPGMTAKQTAKYYFRGNPVPAQELRTDMSGPYDDSYLFSDTIGIADLVWSPCGASRTLNAQTRLVLQNNAQKTGSGYLNTTSVDGEVETVFRFGLSWRQCGGPAPTASVPIYRAYNPSVGDHLQGLGPNEAAPAYRPEGIGFKLFAQDQGSGAALYRCRVRQFHFLSRAANCEGQVTEGQLGFVSETPRDGLVEIFRCLSPRGLDHLTTANPQECTNAGFRIEGSQGYAIP